jgi:Zn-dependent protease with chaperone function
LGSVSSLITSLIIGKRFEREADQFACQQAGRGQGLIDYFEDLKAREQKIDDSYVQTESLIQINKDQLGWYGHHTVHGDYQVAKILHVFNKARRYIYHHTRFGAHPSHDERITRAKKQLAQ